MINGRRQKLWETLQLRKHPPPQKKKYSFLIETNPSLCKVGCFKKHTKKHPTEVKCYLKSVLGCVLEKGDPGLFEHKRIFLEISI